MNLSVRECVRACMTEGVYLQMGLSLDLSRRMPVNDKDKAVGEDGGTVESEYVCARI